MVDSDCQRPLCIFWGARRRRWTSEFHSERALSIHLDHILGIPTRECDFRWCRCPPFGSYCPGSPSFCTDHPNTELSQTAKDVLASQDTLVYIFEHIEGFFKRLETYIDFPTMEAMKNFVEKIMVEVLGIFGIVMKEMKQGPASGSLSDDTLPVADKDSEKYLKSLIGR